MQRCDLTPREHWASRWGFILAAMGSAVGLGNIWRFSYVAGENGGGTFLLVYVLCVLLIGLPIVMAEFTIGRKSQCDVVGAFTSLAPGKPWVVAGIMGVSSAFIILSFYGVIGGWTVKYLVSYLTGSLWSTPENGYDGFFIGFITNAYEPLFWQFVFMAFTIGIVFLGVKKGIETANRILMPLLAILLLVLALYSLSLGAAREAISFLFSPDWSALSRPELYLAALGQAFFSLSLGMGALITYSSYLTPKEKLPGAAVGVVSLDTMFAIVAGLVIFPAVFAFGGEPGAGPGLVFITLPDIFQNLAIGVVVGIAFFFLLAAAALSSAMSLLEVAVSYFMRVFGWGRHMTTVVIGGIIFLVGIPSSLGLGVLSNVTIFGKDILDSMDFLASNIFLPLGGMIIALFIGWGWKKSDALESSDFGDTLWGNAWIFILRFVAPVAIGLVFLRAIGLF